MAKKHWIRGVFHYFIFHLRADIFVIQQSEKV